MKKPKANYLPRIVWECENLYHRGYWIVSASAEIPGDSSLVVSGQYHIPHVYAERPPGLAYYLKEVVRDAEVSLTSKYNLLVRKHAHKNKHAHAALAVITEWQARRDHENG